MSNANWGAIPRSLANDVSNMIEKKMGTSSGYKPSEWANEINLMGKLPIKTASGAIASFSDGADDVPVKSCVVTFTPSGGGGTPSSPVPINGYTGLTLTNHGKNYIGDIQQGGIDATNGKEMAYNTRVRTGFIRVEPNTQYTCAVNSSNPNLVIFHILEYETASDANYIDSSNVTIATKTFTTSANTNYVRFTSRDTTNANITPTDLANWQMEKGSTATTYEAYNASVVTDTFGQTIMGGERDLTTDGMTSDMTKDAMTYSYLSGLSSDYLGYTASVSAMSNHPCIWVRNWNYSQMPTFRAGGIKCGVNAFPDVHINDSSISSTQYRVYFDVTGCNISSVQDFLDAVQAMEQNGDSLEVAYELATPTEITGLTSHDIRTMLGDNNFYADTGNTEVSYRSASMNVPFGDYDDPFNILTDYSRYNVSNLYSAYYIEGGDIKKEVVFQTASDSGYEGFCISLDSLNLTSGTTYTLSFVLDVPTTVTFSGTYPWGIKYSSSRVPSSGNAGSSTFNITPTVNFAEQTGTQNVSITFTASSTNYLLVLMARLALNVKAWIKMKDIRIEEST